MWKKLVWQFELPNEKISFCSEEVWAIIFVSFRFKWIDSVKCETKLNVLIIEKQQSKILLTILLFSSRFQWEAIRAQSSLPILISSFLCFCRFCFYIDFRYDPQMHFQLFRFSKIFECVMCMCCNIAISFSFHRKRKIQASSKTHIVIA